MRERERERAIDTNIAIQYRMIGLALGSSCDPGDRGGCTESLCAWLRRHTTMAEAGRSADPCPQATNGPSARSLPNE